MGKTAKYNLPFPEATDKANVPLDIQKLAEAAEAALENKVKSEIGKRLMTDAEGEKLASLENYDDTELNETIGEQATKIEELEEQNKQLLKDYKPIPFNSSSNHLQDTGELPMPISINGGIEQDTTEGYQLFDITQMATEENNGITLTIDKEGIATLNGTATASVMFRSLRKQTISGTGNEAIRINQLSGSISGGNLKFIAQDTNYANARYAQIGSVVNNMFLFEGIDFNIFSLTVDAGVTCTNLKLGLVISSGKTEYEKYTGGQAMPNIDFPSEVKGVGGHYDTVVENKNLWNIDKAILKSGSGLGVTYEDKKFTMTTVTGVWSNVYVMLKNPKKNDYISVGADFLETLCASKKGVSIYGNNSPTLEGITNLISVMQDVSLNIKKRISAGANTKDYEYILIRFWDNATATLPTTKTNCVVDNIQMEFGEPTEHIEHQEQLLPIDIPEGKVLYNENPVVELTDAEIEELGLEKAELYFKDEFGKQELNSSLTIARYVVGGFDCYRITGLQNLNNSANAIIKSNIFEGIVPIYDNTSSIINRKVGDIYINNVINAIDMLTKNGEYADLTSFINAVTGNYFVYQLAKPIYTPIKDENFIKQYRDLQKAHSYYEVTNINSYGSEDDADLVLSGNALMSNDIRLSKIENAILSIGGNV